MRYLLLIIILSGCSMDAKVKEQSGIYHCTDFRDGETWDFDAATARDARYGLGAPSTITVTDTRGKVRVGSSDQNAYIKCVKIS
jgi:hypothetical protein